jgi:uncharacterized protein YegL
MRTGKKGRPSIDPMKKLEELLHQERSNLEVVQHAASPPDDESKEANDGDAPEADHALTTLAVIILDVSGSVSPYAKEVVDSLIELLKKLKDDAFTALGIRVGVVTTWETVWKFKAAADFEVPALTFGSGTPLGRVTSSACRLVEEEMEASAAAGRPLNKMLVALITDGKPAGESPDETRQGVRDAKRMREGRPPLNFFVFKVGRGEPGDFLRAVAGPKRVIHAAEPETAYNKIFNWLAGTMKSASMSQPNQVAETEELPQGLRLSIE